MFKQLKGVHLNRNVQEQVKLYILESGMKPGDVLPTEKELAENLMISRSSIREAFRSLEALGIIETKHGVGRFLKEFDYEAILQNLVYNIQIHARDFSDIIDVRIALEMSFLDTVVTALTYEDIQALYRIIDVMEQKIEEECSDEDLIENHRDFHLTLYKRTENALLLHLIRIFSDMQYTLTVTHRYHTSNKCEFVELHRNLIKALETRDIDYAKEHLLKHYKDVTAWRREHPKENNNQGKEVNKKIT